MFSRRRAIMATDTQTVAPVDAAAIQALLNAAVGAGLPADGVMGPRTRAALCRFQLAHGLPGSGEPDQETLAVLRETVRCQQRLSLAGIHFIYAHEAERGVSDRLYWPGGDSGVTLGAGYDMRDRSAAAIEADLAGLGLPPAACSLAAQASGLANGEAEDFAGRHAMLFCLTPEQEEALLHHTVPPYEAIVRRDIRVSLAQHEFDALVSFVYNPGGSFGPIATLINTGDIAQALQKIRSRVFSGRMRLEALARRRRDETALYLTGRYELA
jgi:GH24 family phage-related lysozyme (muramidase)